MADTDSVSSGLEWYKRSLAQVLGLVENDPILPLDQLSDLETDAQRKAVLNLLNRRFLRSVDPETGMVTIDQTGISPITADADQAADPVAAAIASHYLGAAGAAVAAIDPAQCVPGVCAEQIAGLLGQTRSTLQAVAAEAAVPESAFQMYLHLNDLTNEDYGLIARLGEIYGRQPGPAGTIGGERILASLRVAKRALNGFEEAIREIREGDGEPTLAEIADAVRNCGSHIARHAETVRRAFQRAGIGTCELRSVNVPLGACIQLSGESFERVSLDQALAALVEEPGRLAVLAGSGRAEAIDAVIRAAQTLDQVVRSLDVTAILDELGLSTEAEAQASRPAADVEFAMIRLKAYACAFFMTLLREGTPPPGGRYRDTEESAPLA
jgi:hypothetical protein